MKQNNSQQALATYVSDLLALERHIRIPLDVQRKNGDLADTADGAELLGRLTIMSDQHIEQLKECLRDLGGYEIAGVDSAVTRGLRDDYTALALLCAGYTALIAAANAMGERALAAIAEALLESYAGLMMDVAHALPAVVVHELAASGVDVDASTISTSAQQVARAWQTQSQQQPVMAAPSRMTIGSTDSAFAGSEIETPAF